MPWRASRSASVTSAWVYRGWGVKHATGATHRDLENSCHSWFVISHQLLIWHLHDLAIVQKCECSNILSSVRWILPTSQSLEVTVTESLILIDSTLLANHLRIAEWMTQPHKEKYFWGGFWKWFQEKTHSENFEKSKRTWNCGLKFRQTWTDNLFTEGLRSPNVIGLKMFLKPFLPWRLSYIRPGLDAK